VVTLLPFEAAAPHETPAQTRTINPTIHRAMLKWSRRALLVPPVRFHLDVTVVSHSR
jgi:hypothetical protein